MTCGSGLFASTPVCLLAKVNENTDFPPSCLQVVEQLCLEAFSQAIRGFNFDDDFPVDDEVSLVLLFQSMGFVGDV